MTTRKTRPKPPPGMKYDPMNARIHTDRNKELINQSLRRVGPLRSIGIDGDDIVRAGNGVLEQAVDLGMKVRIVDAAPDELIAVRRKDLKGADAIMAGLYDNVSGESGGWSEDMLALLESEEGVDFDEIDELRDLVDDDEDEEEPAKPAKEARFKYQEQFGVIVVCKSEKEQARVYRKLQALGLECKVVTT